MAISTIRTKFPCALERAWETVTSLRRYHWRRDLRRIDILSDHQFIETSTDGRVTIFYITQAEPMRRWELDFVNDDIEGHWVGTFSEADGHTEIEFTESIEAKKFYLKPFVSRRLHKQLGQYIYDLSKELS